MRGLYIHIPFCKHICSYCDFPKRIAKNNEQIYIYINELIKELETYKNYLNEDIKTIYIGGGTPNVLSDKLLYDLFSAIDRYNLKPLEYSIEINPELLTVSQVKLFKEFGVNRISLGAQNFIDSDLTFLGRHHNKQDIINAVNLLKNNAINNISIDLMFGHPLDTLDKIKYNIQEFYNLNINHISYYGMILEEKTKFYIDKIKGKLQMLDEDTLADMYTYIQTDLNEKGFKQYEISNYSKNMESIHNKIYWDSLEYVGVGAGACGYLDGIRYDNNTNLNLYFNQYVASNEKLSTLEKKQEFMILGLRMMDGVSNIEYFNRFNSHIENDFNLDKLYENKLIENIDTNIKLTKKGIMLSNIVFECFI